MSTKGYDTRPTKGGKILCLKSKGEDLMLKRLPLLETQKTSEDTHCKSCIIYKLFVNGLLTPARYIVVNIIGF